MSALRRFLLTARSMRDLQKRWFDGDKSRKTLRDAKSHEADFDRMLGCLMNAARQPDLFSVEAPSTGTEVFRALFGAYVEDCEAERRLLQAHYPSAEGPEASPLARARQERIRHEVLLQLAISLEPSLLPTDTDEASMSIGLETITNA